MFWVTLPIFATDNKQPIWEANLSEMELPTFDDLPPLDYSCSGSNRLFSISFAITWLTQHILSFVPYGGAQLTWYYISKRMTTWCLPLHLNLSVRMRACMCVCAHACVSEQFWTCIQLVTQCVCGTSVLSCASLSYIWLGAKNDLTLASVMQKSVKTVPVVSLAARV